MFLRFYKCLRLLYSLTFIQVFNLNNFNLNGGNPIKSKSLLKIFAVILIVFLSMSVVSTSELSDTISDSTSDDDSNIKSSDEEVISVDESDSDQEIIKVAGEDKALSADEDSAVGSGDDSSDSSTDGAADASAADSTDDSSGDFEDCNLTISKEGTKKVKVGEIVTWKITVKNTLNLAENVVIQEKLPKNFKLVSVNASKGTYNEEMGYWEIGSLNKSESATLTIKAKAKKAGNYTNKADLFTDSNNLNENTTVKADVEVVAKDKQKAIVKKNKNKKEKAKTKNTNKTNNANETNKKVDFENAGNPIMVILISIFTVLGLSVLGKQK